MKQFVDADNFLEVVASEAESASEDAQAIAKGLDENRLNWKETRERWSIAQCLDHLAVTGGRFEPYFAAVLARGDAGRRASSSIAYRPTWSGAWLIRQVVPESTRRAQAPRIFRPSEIETIQGALEKFRSQHERFMGFVRQAKGLDYNRIRLRSPVTPLLRYSLADAFVVSVVHTQRHVLQARRVRESPSFPF